MFNLKSSWPGVRTYLATGTARHRPGPSFTCLARPGTQAGRAVLAHVPPPPPWHGTLGSQAGLGPWQAFIACCRAGTRRHGPLARSGQAQLGLAFGLPLAGVRRDPLPSLAWSLRKSAPSRSRSPCCWSPPLPPRRRLLAFVLHATHCLARPPLRPVPSAGDGFLRHCLALLCP
jgi:hypothetical protein